MNDAGGGLDPADSEFAAQIQITYRQTGPVAQAGNVIFIFGAVVAVGAAVAMVGAIAAVASRHGRVAAALIGAALGSVFYAALLIGVGKSMSMLSSYVELRTLEMERHWIAGDNDDDS